MQRGLVHKTSRVLGHELFTRPKVKGVKFIAFQQEDSTVNTVEGETPAVIYSDMVISRNNHIDPMMSLVIFKV